MFKPFEERPSGESFTAVDQSTADLGTLQPKDDEMPSFTARIEAERDKNRNSTSTTPSPFMRNVFYDALDIASTEAFSANLTAGSDPELIKQAQQIARAAIDDMIDGNEMMNVSPDDLEAMKDEVNDIANGVIREALALNQAGSNNSGKRSKLNLSEVLREKIREFMFEHRKDWRHKVEDAPKDAKAERTH